MTAAANSKVYDGTATAAAVPTISSGSLAAGDTAAFSEGYGSKNAGTGLTLTAADSINDGNGGAQLRGRLRGQYRRGDHGAGRSP